MGQKLHHRIETWKKQLLDFGKKNRLINFRETKRSNVKITTPSFESLFYEIVIHEKCLAFPFAKKVKIDDEGEETYDAIIAGDFETAKSLGELQKTLRVLRQRANSSTEEQGINTLFLAFGLLKWKENDNSEQTLTSPIILVPVRLTIESLTSPYKLSSHEDEIIVNPILIHKLEHDFGIVFPEFDSAVDHISDYFLKLMEIIENKDWEIVEDVNLTLLSFLKINMYKDLERNEEKLNSNAIISAIAGESEPISIPAELNNYDHDNNIKPIDTYQVVDADSSQQDAILLSKGGVSFILQGPPGTGKSQTITNIISEALADGKKVLFVSEKLAALQVVYNRLLQVGLSDYCLTLHSHKVNKKDILRDLANSITADRVKVRDDILTQLDILEKKRAALNDYQRELHTPFSALNYTIFQVNGKLAKLEDIPDIIFDINNVEKITLSELNDRCYLLNEFSKTIGKRSEDYANNVWRNSTVDYLSNELRHDIDSNITFLLPILSEINENIEDSCKKLGLSIKPSIEGLNLLVELLSFVGDSPTIPVKWIYDENLKQLQTKVDQYRSITSEIIEIERMVTEQYNDSSILSINAKERELYLSGLINKLTDKLKCSDVDYLIDNIDTFLTKVETILPTINNLYQKSNNIAVLLGLDAVKKIADIQQLVGLANTLSKEITPPEFWFESAKFNQISTVLNECIELHNDAIKKRVEVLSKCDKEILDIDFYSILKRFRSEYASMFRAFNKQYKNDINTLKQYLSIGNKISYNSAFELLNSLKAVSDKKEEIKQNKSKYEQYFGKYYNGLDTSWGQIKEAISIFNEIVVYFDEGIIPDKLKRLLLSQTVPLNKLSDFYRYYIGLNCDGLLSDTNNITSISYDNSSSVVDVIDLLKEIEQQGNSFNQSYSEIISKRKGSAPFETIISGLTQIAKYQSLNIDIEEQREEIKQQYEQYYSGVKTDWDITISALSFAQRFKIFIEKDKLPEEFIVSICNDSKFVHYCQISAMPLIKLKEKVNNTLQWVIGKFSSEEQLQRYSLEDLIDRLSKCKDKKHLLEEWVDYCSNRQKCYEKGLTSYIEQVEKMSMSIDQIVDAYLKRFYRLWLDMALPLFPAVQSFRGRIHNQTIEEFKGLDVLQLKIAQSRVRERILSRIPDFNSVTSTRDEVGILKREVSKQRKLMPLRKLFNSIPNLLTTLRPCFMMSPLSVSVFLEAQSYDFDMVIFDEASQVCTEDAIGAIMRGKQVIIVGDINQLPPTNFFTNSIEEEDFDVDIELPESDAGAYQSILNEAVAILPERSLRWHYRSRNEQLIAFSNIKIYNNYLITFPSATEQAENNGVEYVYVSNGVYDRGGKRNNIAEAKRVADLVFEHYRKFPNRSLGVVTFSEAQQQAIDAAIRQKRLLNGMLDQFFAEDRDEPFFIKNLENVQGDERDTIIFSIGYAKDERGLMYMNFGPLSKDGGHRRLNVAITRAKYNIKLVGSISATDIDLDRSSSEGVRLLRSYIEFAQQGIVALQKELSYTYSVQFDSPFEEAVYDFLVANGYEVVTQVGCSGFRVDMAIKHPHYSGMFAIGIECDGATYHSSRTARERDRLRQTVLEDMGWTIYRIWSSDWIKDPKSEEQRLVNAVNRALNRLASTAEEESLDANTTESSFEIIEEKVDIEELYLDDCDFVPYEQADISNFSYLDTHEIIKKVIEIEQPIHFEELCRRVAPLFGNQKATSKVREGVEYQFRFYLANDVVRKDEFISLVGCEDFNVRVPNESNDYLRPINFISEEEIGRAMIVIAKKSYGISPENLFVATARNFGFNRTGANIITTLRTVYDDLFNRGIVKLVDEKVAVN